jgi:hypothetical protein
METFAGPYQLDEGKSKSPHIVRLASVKGTSPIVGSGISSSSGDRPQLISKFHIRSPTHEPSGSKSTVSTIDLTEKSTEFGVSPSTVEDHALNTTSSHTEEQTPPPTSHQATHSTAYTISTANPQGSISLGSLSEEELDEEHDKAVLEAVELSIARQISVSRDQRRMLGPLQMHPVEGRRVAETKSSTPRLVDPRTDSSSPFAGHRKSERVVLESA